MVYAEVLGNGTKKKKRRIKGKRSDNTINLPFQFQAPFSGEGQLNGLCRGLRLRHMGGHGRGQGDRVTLPWKELSNVKREGGRFAMCERVW